MALLLAGAGAYVYSNQDQILSFVVKELNQSLKAEIKVKTYKLDLFSHFPEVAIHFSEVECLEVTPQPNEQQHPDFDNTMPILPRSPCCSCATPLAACVVWTCLCCCDGAHGAGAVRELSA